MEETVYICDAHGAGIGNKCCINAEDTGWSETVKKTQETKSNG